MKVQQLLEFDRKRKGYVWPDRTTLPLVTFADSVVHGLTSSILSSNSEFAPVKALCSASRSPWNRIKDSEKSRAKRLETLVTSIQHTRRRSADVSHCLWSAEKPSVTYTHQGCFSAGVCQCSLLQRTREKRPCHSLTKSAQP